MKNSQLKKISKLIRYYILTSTSQAGSGHPSSSLSATDFMTTLFFSGFFRADLAKPKYFNNDKIIFSKGHAVPLLYSIYTALGIIREKDLLNFRKIDSDLEGHPTMNFKYTEAATGSLGQGLGIGVGDALNAKIENLDYKTFVLLGDSELAEGSNWEAIQIASYYKLNNLIAMVDVNRLGQRGETMLGHDLKTYKKRFESFSWKTYIVDGNNFNQIKKVFKKATAEKNKPVCVLFKTKKGSGISLLENKENWHGKVLNKKELDLALQELGEINKKLDFKISKPKEILKNNIINKKIVDNKKAKLSNYILNEKVSTRKAYGVALSNLAGKYKDFLVLDAETSNSTGSDIFKELYKDRFFEMFIAEQNMVSVAVGFASQNKKTFVSTFSAFFSRTFDQIRMASYSKVNITFVGSHAGVSIGADGSSQMGLEDIALFRSIFDSVVFYPSDAVSTEKILDLCYHYKNISYVRTTREETDIIYKPDEKFEIGGSKVLYSSKKDVVTLVGAGITLHECLKAYKILKEKNISARVIDLYSVKPIDTETLKKALKDTGKIIVVEDHYKQGGIYEAICSELINEKGEIISLAVNKMPHSGTKEELLKYEGIDAENIVKKV
jgi:transketolase